VVALASHELDIDERDVDRLVAGRTLQDLARGIGIGDCADHLRRPGFMDQLDEIVARRPLVLHYQRTELHDRASAGTSMIDTVRPFALSSRKLAAPAYFSARRRVTNSIPRAPERRAGEGPGPLSSTMHLTRAGMPGWSSVRTATTPPSAQRRAPCFTAFSK